MEQWCNSESWLLGSLCIFIPSLPHSSFPILQPQITVNGLKTTPGKCGFCKNEESFQLLWMNKKSAFPREYCESTLPYFSIYGVNITQNKTNQNNPKTSYLWIAGKYCHFTVTITCTDPIHGNTDPISRCFLYFTCLSGTWKSHGLSFHLSWINDLFSWGHLEREKRIHLLGMQGVSKGFDLLHGTNGKFSFGHSHYMIRQWHRLLPGIYFAMEDAICVNILLQCSILPAFFPQWESPGMRHTNSTGKVLWLCFTGCAQARREAEHEQDMGGTNFCWPESLWVGWMWLPTIQFCCWCCSRPGALQAVSVACGRVERWVSTAEMGSRAC